MSFEIRQGDSSSNLAPGIPAGGNPSPRTDVPLGYLHRTIAAVAVITAAVGVILMLWFQIHVLLLGAAGVLVAVFLYTVSDWLHQRIHLPYWLALLLVCLVLLALIAGTCWLTGERIAQQVVQLRQQIPQSVGHLKDYLSQRSWGRWALERLHSRASAAGANIGRTGVSQALEDATDTFVVVFVGLFSAINPGLYVRGFLSLLPCGHPRRRAREVISALRWALWWWLVGQWVAMAFIGVITGLVVWMLGVPLALTLAVLAALLNFIPNFGPLLAAIPAVLIALLQGPLTALWIALAYIGIQALQDHVVTPVVQQRVANLPPVILMLSQLFMYYWDGVLGMIMAPPLALVIIRVVQMLYVQEDAEEPAPASPS